MKSFLIPIATLAMMTFPLVAQAQTTQSEQSTSAAGSNAGAGAAANYYGGTDTAIYPQLTPSPTAPAFVTASPCMGDVSGAGTSPVVGIALGMSYTDKECELRSNASALNSLGSRIAAIQLMCQIKSVKAAMEAAGTPCASIKESDFALPSKPMDQTEFKTTGTGYILDNGEVLPVATSKLKEFCKTLSWHKKSDRPYLESECAGH